MYLKLVFILLMVIFFITGCQANSNKEQTVTQTIHASNFQLEVTTPTVVKKGEKLRVKGLLTYVGEQTIELYHGDPIIQFTFTGTEEDHGYNDLGKSTKLVKGQIIEVEEEFKAMLIGKHNLLARTTLLVVNGKPIDGVGNEKHIKLSTNNSTLELENSKITLDLIEIQVR